jgi:hypothetical protein
MEARVFDVPAASGDLEDLVGGQMARGTGREHAPGGGRGGLLLADLSTEWLMAGILGDSPMSIATA